MKIERVDDKTVKCYLSNEELEEYEIDYKDFITRTDKAREVVQEIMEQAAEEVGYKPPKFAFDLQIMMVPDQGLVLTFSEKEPFDPKDGEQILEALKEMKKVLQESKENFLQKKALAGDATQKQLPNHTAPAQASNSEQTQNPAGGQSPQAKGTVKQRPETAIFAFRNIGRVMDYASVLPANLRVKSALYVLDNTYYLYMNKGNAAYERYSRACVQALEFAALCGAEQEKLLYLEEHGECLIAEKALKLLRVE